jgi:hypothetical protein
MEAIVVGRMNRKVVKTSVCGGQLVRVDRGVTDVFIMGNNSDCIVRSN